MMIREESNPIITREQIPDAGPHLRDVSSVFNPGAVRFGDRTVLLLRVQNRGRETITLLAESRDGIDFTIRPEPVVFEGIEEVEGAVFHCYDMRITAMDDTFYIMFAVDMEGRCEVGLGRTRDFESFEFMGIVSDGDTRNGVLFPGRVKGRYLRLDRPNSVKLESGVTTGDAIMLSESEDLLAWRTVAPVIGGRWHYWDELVGAGPPPIRTRAGWLQIYHGVATHLNAGVYQAGVMLLDLESPERLLSRGRYNILEPRAFCEMVGQVPNVVFPCGAVVDRLDAGGFAHTSSRVDLYYGAADSCVCLARATVEDLIAAARTG
jgi:beta-1,4-mannooligosaccharide/beta-1,4-mannosyl-N-acetylglucosamine phosphorylase